MKKIDSLEALAIAVKEINFTFIIQNFSEYDLELAVFCYRIPGTDESGITSLCKKEFLSVNGDGTSTLAQLIFNKPRASLEYDRLSQRDDLNMSAIPPQGERILLEPIGNHCRGTKFIDIQNQITPDMEKSFRDILNQMEGVHYGRFDLKCRSLESASRGEDIDIFELNGTASEPAHCYDPKNSLGFFYKTMIQHWRIMYRIYKKLSENGSNAMSISEYISFYLKYVKLVRNYN